MHKFYWKAGLFVAALIVLSCLCVATGFFLSSKRSSLLPASKAVLPWYPSKSLLGNDEQVPKLEVREDGQNSNQIDYSFWLPEELANPYASFIFYFTQAQSLEDLIDLSGYTGIEFEVSCEPKNILILVLFTYAEGVTELDRPETFRVNLSFFQCSPEKDSVYIPFSDLNAADWWLERYGVNYTNRMPDLSKVHGFAINNSLQSPRKKLSEIKVQKLALRHTETLYRYLSIALVLMAWVIAALKLVQFYVREKVRAAEAKVKMARPLVAYQKISVQQEATDLKTKLLKHIAVHYCKPELSIEDVAHTLGTNRTKINEILKDELQLTFTHYVNKLRLTEAARLLTENKELSIMRIAFEVGFNNVTYFNTKFKQEYGCTPKMFRGNSK